MKYRLITEKQPDGTVLFSTQRLEGNLWLHVHGSCASTEDKARALYKNITLNGHFPQQTVLEETTV
jgi:hypothetical protein